MKKFLSMMSAVAMLLAYTACTNEDDDDYRTYSVAVQLMTITAPIVLRCNC